MLWVGNLPTTITLHPTHASVTERWGNPGHWFWQLAQHVHKEHIIKFGAFITWRLTSLKGNGYIKHDPTRVESRTMILFPWSENWIVGGYCANQESQPIPKLATHSRRASICFDIKPSLVRPSRTFRPRIPPTYLNKG